MDLPVAAASVSTVAVLQRLSAGPDPEAWAVLVERHGQAVFRAAYRVTGDHALAEDATQEAFLHLRGDARRFRAQGADAEAAAVGWIVRVACTSALQLMRRLGRQHRHERHYAEEHARTRMDEAHDRAGGTDPELGAALRRELAELPESHRLPLLLHCCGGLDYQRIAEQVGCSPGNARVRVHRALERLRQRLQRAGFATGAAAIAGQLHAADASSLVSPALIAKCHALLASGQAPVLSSSAVFGTSLAAKLGLAAAIGGGVLAIPLAYALTRAPAPLHADAQVREPPAPRQEESRPAAAPAAPPPAPPAPINHRYRGVVVRIDREEHRVAVKQGDRFEVFAWHRRGEGGAALGADEAELGRRLEALAVGSEVEIVWEAAKAPAVAPPPVEPAADGQHRKHHEPHRLIVALEVFGPGDGAGKTDPF